jgi:macrolide-specific efflux system membrane fusion protein
MAALVLFIMIIAGGSGYHYWRNEQKTPSDIATAIVQRGDIEITVTALGNLQPRDYVDVGAQVSGQLDKLHVGIGDTVEKGELLAEIDPEVLLARVEASRAQLQAQKAQLAERQAELELAEQQFRRQENLLSDDATSQDAYQISLAAVKTKHAQIAALKAQIEETDSSLKGDEATLSYTKIYAPMSGTVVDLPTRQGQTLNANLSAPTILRIADLSTMTVWTQVSEADVPKLQVGMDAYFTILGKPGQRWTGKLRQILPTPEIINNVVLYTALFDVANPDGELMTQMTAQVFFVIASANDVLTAPMSALQPVDEKSGRYKATVIGTKGEQTVREVRVGISNRVSAEIGSGLKEGQRIVDNPPKTDSDERRRSHFRIF